MDKDKLLKLVGIKYGELNVKDGRQFFEKQGVRSNQIKALIEVIAPLIDDGDEKIRKL